MKPNKYPVGTTIRYIGGCTTCKGQIGKIVATKGYTPIIDLPKSACMFVRQRGSMMVSWEDIEPVSVKGEQYLFGFMNNGKR